MDKDRFKKLCESNHKKLNNSIGILSEKKLHYVLKNYYEPNTNNHEIKVNNYIVDIKNNNQIIEIQTQNFNQLRNKILALLPDYKLTIVYPIASLKWLSWIDLATGEVSNKRKSPKAGSFYNAFKELYKIKWMLLDNNLTIKLVLLEIEEYRNLDGWSKNLKKGSSRQERYPVDILGELTLTDANSFKTLIPSSLPIPFTTKDYASATSLTPRRTQEAITVLHYIGVIKRIGKRKNAYLYEITGDKNEI